VEHKLNHKPLRNDAPLHRPPSKAKASTHNRRTKQSDPFYASTRWHKLRRVVLRRARYLCAMCGVNVRDAYAARVDHIRSRKHYPELAFSLDNLQVLCAACDNRKHNDKGYSATRRKAINATHRHGKKKPDDPQYTRPLLVL